MCYLQNSNFSATTSQTNIQQLHFTINTMSYEPNFAKALEAN